ncbi:MAG: hypothetical protein ACUZ9M_06490 [Candidatus Scalindua sp.]
MAKLVFNKRCPYCKSNSYDRAYRKFWMRIIPKTKYYVCNKCFRNFMAIFGISDVYEQRKYRHYKVEDYVFVNLPPALSEAFPVVDISRGGLSFWYTTDKEQPAIIKGLEILHSVKGICLKIPSMIMLDRESGNGLSGSDKRTRKCRGKFTNLTRKHKVLLQDIIPELSKN